MSGPLAGLRFVEMAGIGPAPFAAMVLADLGAEGIRIESPRPGLMLGDPMRDITRRGRAGVVVDVRQDAGRDLVLDLVAPNDAFSWATALCSALWLPVNNRHLEGPVLVAVAAGHGATLADLLSVAGLLVAAYRLLDPRRSRRGPLRRAAVLVLLILIGLAGVGAAVAVGGAREG